MTVPRCVHCGQRSVGERQSGTTHVFNNQGDSRIEDGPMGDYHKVFEQRTWCDYAFRYPNRKKRQWSKTNSPLAP